MNYRKLFREWRVLLLILVVMWSIFVIRPMPVKNPDTGLMTLETNIVKGLDLQGGVRALILPENTSKEMVEMAANVLTTRLNVAGLKEMRIAPVEIDDTWYIQIELAGATKKQLTELIESQGKFEAKIQRVVIISENEGMLKFNSVSYPVILNNGSLTVEGKKYELNNTFVLDGVEVQYTNYTEKAVLLTALVYTGSDVVQVFKDVQHTSIETYDNGARFSFTVMYDKKAAEKFAKATKDVSIDFSQGTGRNAYLTANIDLYLDDNLVDSLRIGSGLRGKIETTVQISGSGADKDDAIRNMKNLQGILESGALPTKIDIVQLDEISPLLGENFVKTAVIAIFFAIAVVSILIFIRYKDPRIVLPIIITSGSEVLIIFGIAAWINWTIDLPSIAGIIAAVGTGIDSQIVITDESSSMKEEILSLKQRMKSAFFIIFASAATTVAAMFPLLAIGAGGVKGFALTTIIGVMAGVTLTRPAFAKIIEYVKSE